MFCSPFWSAGTGTALLVSSGVQVLLALLVCRYRHCDFGFLKCSSFARAFGLPVPALRFWFPQVFKFCSRFWSAGTGTAILVSSGVQVLLALLVCRYRHCDFGFLKCSSFARAFGLPVPALRFWFPQVFKFCSRFWSAGTGTAILVSSSVQVLLALLVCRYRHCDFGFLKCSSFARAFGLPVPALRFWFPQVFKFCSRIWSAGTGTAILVSSSVQVLLALLVCRYRHCDFGFLKCSSFARAFGLPVPALRFWFPQVFKFCSRFWSAGTGTAILASSFRQSL